MKRKNLLIALGLLAAFAVFTAAVSWLDVAAIGPDGSSVGFSTVNGWFHRLTGVRLRLYTVTDWLGLVPLGFALGFALLGLKQWCIRRQLRLVDRSILVLGGFYAAVIGAYILFENLGVNFRPILINGVLEASYPSSTTLLVMCVMPTAVLQLRARIQNPKPKKWVCRLLAAFTCFMVLARLLSGVHWLTDIIGGALLSAGLVMLYVWAAFPCGT